MLNIDYFLYAIKAGLLQDPKWYFALFTLPIDKEQKNEFVKIEKNRYLVKVENNWIQLSNVTTERPALIIEDVVELDKTIFEFLDKTVRIKIGRVIAYYALVIYPFKGKIELKDAYLDIGDLEKQISSKLLDKTVTLEEYLVFTDNATFVSNLSKIFSVSATYKNILPPPGINEFRRKKIEELKNKYGEKAFEDYSVVVELENALKEYDDQWLKDDPSYNKLVSGKIKNIARSKMFLTFGAERGFELDNKATYVEESLLDGYPIEDKKKLSTIFNSIRAASFSRGMDTQKGGVTAKVVLRATSSIKIEHTDCGTKMGVTRDVTKKNYKKYVNRYILVNGKTVLIKNEDDAKSYIGKTIMMRSPQYCKLKTSNLCEKCVDDILKNYETGMSLVMTDISNVLLNDALKKMHGGVLSVIEVTMDDLLE